MPDDLVPAGKPTSDTANQGGRRRPGVSLTEGEPRRHIVKLAGYVMLGSIATMTFQLADAYFVAQLGTQNLAALALTLPVVMILHAIAIGLGTGVTAVISRAYGRGDMERARVLTTDSITLGFAIALVFAVVGHATMDPLFRVMGTTEAMLPLVESYMDVWYYGMPFMVVPLIANAVIRAFGDAKFPSMIMATSAVLNIVLDPILIFGAFGIPAMGLQGAAVALLLSRLVTLTASLAVLHYRLHALDYRRPTMARLKESWAALLHIGLPATGTQMISPVSSAILTSLVASYGATAIAAYGVAIRIEMFALILTMALSISIAPFVGQNAGSGQMHRVRNALSFSNKVAMLYGLAVAVLLAVAGRLIVGGFSNDASVVDVATAYMWIVPVSYGAMGVMNVSSSCLNALAKPMPAMAIGLSKSLFVQIPMAYLGAALWGIEGVFAGMAASTLIVACAAFVLSRRAVAIDPVTASSGPATAPVS